jgi:glycosyltransferase involved in cell wall biosynthesis
MISKRDLNLNRPINVAVVAACPFPYPRGTPTRAYRTAEAIAQRGHKVDVITYHLGRETGQIPFTIHRTPPVKRYQRLEPGPTYGKLAVIDTLLVAKLWSFVRNNHVDVIHAHHYEGLLVALPVSRLYRIPLIYDAHTLLDSELEHYEMGLPRSSLRTFGRMVDHYAPRLATHVIATTETIKYVLTKRHGLADDRVTIVTGGVELDHFDRPATASAESPTLIYTGNLAAFQGIEQMLRAFQIVRQARDDVRLRIVTNGNFGRYTTLTRQLGIDDAIELLPDSYALLPERLSAATIALNPRPLATGLPQKLLNYMAAGRPIVSFAGSAERLVHGKHGWLVKGSAYAAFAQSILHVLANPGLAQRLGDNARRLARVEFSWPYQGKLIEDTYRALLQPQANDGQFEGSVSVASHSAEKDTRNIT